MKKSILFIFALMAVMSLSCKKEALTDGSGSENTGNTTGEYAYTIKGTFASEDDAAAGDSKVGIGKEGEKNYFGTWEEGDQVVIYEVVQAQNSRTRITEEPIVVSNISEDGKSADIRFNIRENVPLQPPTPSGQTTPPDKVLLDENTKCRAFYYSDALMDTYGRGILAAEQVQNGTGLENTSLKKYAFIYTTNDASVKNKVKDPANNCAFYHALSYVDISFSSEDFEGWKVDRIAMYNESGTPMAASQYNVNCSITPWPHTVVSSQGTVNNYASAVTELFGDKSSRITLSFSDEVILSSDVTQDACLVSLPTHLLSEEVAGKPSEAPQIHTVLFQLSKDGKTEYAKVRFNTCLKGGCVKKLKVGAIRKTDITNDYKDIYDAGFDIKIGDMVVNKTTFPTATLAKPDEFTNDNDGYTKYFAGGLLFVDDITSKAVIDMSEATSNRNIATNSKGLVVVGRYKDAGSQTQINVVDMRTRYDVAFLNLRLNLKRNSDSVSPGQCIFEKNSSETVSSALRLVDCYLDVAQATSATQHSTVAVIRDRASNGTSTAAPYSKVLVDNCVVKLASRSGKPTEAATRFYYHFKSGDESEIERSVDITNNVIFTENVCLPASCVALKNSSNDTDVTKSPNLSINFSGNTIANLGSQYGVLYYYTFESNVLPVKSFVANKNLAYFENCRTMTYTTAKFSMTITPNKDVTVAKVAGDNNWVGAVNVYDSKNSNDANYQLWHLTGKSNNGTQTVDPFTTKDYVNGYFPINTTVVTNGAGASYDTKGYCEWTATTE